jgi:hypothetical protein
MIRLHLQSGVTDLKDIRESYNSYAEGGNLYSGEQKGSNYLSPIQPKPVQQDFSFVPNQYNPSVQKSTNNNAKAKPKSNSNVFKDIQSAINPKN